MIYRSWYSCLGSGPRFVFGLHDTSNRRSSMDSPAMVATQLTPELITEGAKLVEALDLAGIAPDAALWMYFPDVSAWKLLLAEDKVGPEGPRGVYRTIQKTLHGLRKDLAHLSLEDIALAKPDAPLIRLLGQAFTTGPGISGIRFTRNVINGTLIEDAYIYRLKKAA